MKVVVVFDHKFKRLENGSMFSSKQYNYKYFQERYLGPFTKVSIIARHESIIGAWKETVPSEGSGVRVVSVGEWTGVSGMVRHLFRIVRVIRDECRDAAGIVLIAPGMLSYIARYLIGSRPYAVEVVGDPAEALRYIGGGPLATVGLRVIAAREMAAVCRNAKACLYVTRGVLQKVYPCKGVSVSASDVNIGLESVVSMGRRHRNVVGSKRRLVTVAWLDQPYKGIGVLINALKELTVSGCDAELSIIGEGRLKQKYMEEAARLGLRDRVKFYGALAPGEEVISVLRECEVFVLASLSEGLPRALIEAMAQGLPCIGSRVGGVIELLHPEDLVEAGNVSMLAASISAVLQSPDRMDRMSERNMEKAREYIEDRGNEAVHIMLSEIVSATGGHAETS
jgi:glycosyltransferase involved in cell wall biosynthesis